MPHPHRHHGHGHAHSRSRSPTRAGTLNHSFKLDMSSATTLVDHDSDHAPHVHDAHHQHSHSLSSESEPHEHNHGFHVHSTSKGTKMHERQHIPPPLHMGNGFTATSTAAGKLLMTPQNASFSEQYKAPESKPPKSAHDHSAERSRFTKLLLPYTARWPLLHTVMTEKDSRRIFYFMSLNFSFMVVQAFYGYATDSLGLLSDSVHMFFDCVALAVGIFASVASKWPPSARFPYGFGKVETLSGFANGVFLVLISVEIMIEAFERIIEGRETKRLAELFIVSSLGLTVNLVGMAAFGHHHHGHGGSSHGCSHGHAHAHEDSHSHSHSHTPSHSHSHSAEKHSHSDSHDHEHDHDHDHEHKAHEHSHDHAAHQHGHSHSHDNENMYGIYLHVLADTLGSAAVIASTILTHFIPWAGWDPLASFLIAALIMASSVPLIRSSAQRLLLTVPDEIEYSLRDTLSGIMSLRGVAGYAVPKFWMNDRTTDSPGELLGSMHVLITRSADMEDVRVRVRNYFADKGIDITLQLEREGDTSCWCGVGKSPLSPLSATTPLSAATPTSATISQRLKSR
ncbi:unnamed protein product [Discula destructiva]